jgi:hypothetical protein
MDVGAKHLACHLEEVAAQQLHTLDVFCADIGPEGAGLLGPVLATIE